MVPEVRDSRSGFKPPRFFTSVLNLEDIFDLAMANSVHSRMQVNCRVTILDPNFKLRSDLDTGRQVGIDIDQRVFGMQSNQLRVGYILQRRQSSFAANRL